MVSGKWRVLLVDEPDYPGFCRVVWNDHVAEMTDLSEADRAEVMSRVAGGKMCIRVSCSLTRSIWLLWETWCLIYTGMSYHDM